MKKVLTMVVEYKKGSIGLKQNIQGTNFGKCKKDGVLVQNRIVIFVHTLRWRESV